MEQRRFHASRRSAGWRSQPDAGRLRRRWVVCGLILGVVRTDPPAPPRSSVPASAVARPEDQTMPPYVRSTLTPDRTAVVPETSRPSGPAVPAGRPTRRGPLRAAPSVPRTGASRHQFVDHLVDQDRPIVACGLSYSHRGGETMRRSGRTSITTSAIRPRTPTTSARCWLRTADACGSAQRSQMCCPIVFRRRRRANSAS